MIKLNFLQSVFFVLLITLVSCNKTDDDSPHNNQNNNQNGTEEIFPDIDLNNWKVTLPIGDPLEIEPPEILNYANINVLKDYMFNDTDDGSLVFFTQPGTTTPNSSYSRTELREQLDPGSNNTNWTFAQGGNLDATLKVTTVSGPDGNKDRIIVLQIHGRLTDEQRDLIGEDDNNAPPVLKIYWDDGKINVRRKVLKDVDVNEEDMLRTDAWEDESHWFEQSVDFDQFDMSIEASENLLKVTLNDEELSFSDIHVEKWNVFENYFKAGNYLQSSDENSYAQVKFYNLVVTH